MGARGGSDRVRHQIEIGSTARVLITGAPREDLAASDDYLRAVLADVVQLPLPRAVGAQRRLHGHCRR